MSNYLEIMDYKGSKRKIPINLKHIKSIYIHVITGDEICEIEYDYGECKEYDSSKNRFFSFDDGCYCIYDVNENINYINEFKTRKNSYDISWLKKCKKEF